MDMYESMKLNDSIDQIEQRQAAYETLTQMGSEIDTICRCMAAYGIDLHQTMNMHLAIINRMAEAERKSLERLKDIRNTHEAMLLDAASGI